MSHAAPGASPRGFLSPRRTRLSRRRQPLGRRAANGAEPATAHAPSGTPPPCPARLAGHVPGLDSLVPSPFAVAAAAGRPGIAAGWPGERAPERPPRGGGGGAALPGPTRCDGREGRAEQGRGAARAVFGQDSLLALGRPDVDLLPESLSPFPAWVSAVIPRRGCTV